MKRLIPFTAVVLLFSACSRPPYRVNAVEYWKTHVKNAVFVDTVKFLKPDSVFSGFHDTQEYQALMKAEGNFEAQGDSVQLKETRAAIAKKEKSFKNKLVWLDVSMIYKAKDKKGVIKTDTCRFTFDSTLSTIKDLNGVSF